MFSLSAQVVRCDLPDHCHTSPMIKIIDISQNGHSIHIEQDGDVFNAFLDGDLAGKIGITGRELYDLLKGLRS
jgi:hypothetical protein